MPRTSDSNLELPPDFRRLLIRALNHDPGVAILHGLDEDSVQLLKQKTAFNVVDMEIEESKRLQFPDTAALDESPISLSAGLARVDLENGGYLIVAEFSKRSSFEDWRWEGHRVKAMGNPPLKPYIALSTVDVRGLKLAIYATVDEIGSIRLTLADGTIYDDSVVNGGALLHALYSGPAAWNGTGTVEIIDRESRVVSRSNMWLSPYPPASMFQDNDSDRTGDRR